MPDREPIVIAHRGLAGYAPENTLAAYEAAFALRLGVEADIRVTADEQVVVIHDYTLGRTTNGSGEVKAHTLEALRTLDAGSWFHPSFAGERLPTLEEVCELAASFSTPFIALDVKPTGPDIEDAICTCLERFGLMESVVGIGELITYREFRRRFKARNGAFPAARWARSSDEWAIALSDETCDWIYLREIPTSSQVREAESTGKRIFVSGDAVMRHCPDNWLTARDAGVHALNTDFPLECRQAFRA